MRMPLFAATALTGSMLFLVPGAQAFDWNGPYVGGVAGVVKSTGSIDWSFDDGLGTPSGTFEFEGSGALAGVTAGINFKLDDKFVVGIEGDASIASLSNSGTFVDFPTVGSFEEELDSLLTLRARFGILTPDQSTLFYATAGLAGGNVSASAMVGFAGDDGVTAATVSGFTIGTVAGVGVEHAITDALTVKAEILGYSLGSLDGNGYAGKGDSAATYNPSGIVFRTGINFHF